MCGFLWPPTRMLVFNRRSFLFLTPPSKVTEVAERNLPKLCHMLGSS